MSGAMAGRQMNPFPGLRPFREDEAYLFFGRENQVDVMVDKLANTRFLAVVGTSGSGKSSLVNCGLRPALRQGLMANAGAAWRMAQFRPGSDPIRAMAHALGRDEVLFREDAEEGLSPTEIIEITLRMSKLGLIDIFEQTRLDEGLNLLVAVDQFEELFRYRHLDGAKQENDQRVSGEAFAFVNLLLEATQQKVCPIFVVLTMRSDFLGDCAQFPGLVEAINAGLYLVPRMTRDERRVAIDGPVRVAGAEIASVLLTRLVNDVGDNPDQLSILQHALNRTWAHWQDEGREKEPLHLRHYEAIGTMAQALDQHAEQAYAELGSQRLQQVCERLFKALTDKATDPRGVRRPTKLNELSTLSGATAEEVTKVIDVFRNPNRAFLMPPAGEKLTGETVIDISHESLMRIWRRLDTWAEEEREFLIGNQQLKQELRDWEKATDTDKSAALLTGPRLNRARGWLVDRPSQLTAQERTFIEASTNYADAEERRKEKMRRDAIANESRALAALSQAASYQGHYTDAVKLALAAWPRSVTDERPMLSRTIDALAQALAGPLEVSPPLQHDGSIYSAVFSPDGARVVTGSDDGTARVWDAATGVQIGKPLQHKGAVNSVTFSPDGALVVTGSDDSTARVWDAATGAPIGKPLQHEDRVRSALFSPDGALVVTASFDKTARVWDAATGAQIGESMRHEGWINRAAFSRDGARVLTASYDHTARVWDAATGAPIGEPLRHDDAVASASFSPDGVRVVTASFDKTARVWNTSGAQLDKTLRHDDIVVSAVFSPDGARVATASGDTTARVWDAATGGSIGRPLQHDSFVYSASFSPDGARVVTASGDKTARVWDASTGGSIGKPLQHNDIVVSASFSPDGARVATASGDMTARVWDVATGGSIGKPLQHDDAVITAMFSPHGPRVVTASRDNCAQVWDAVTAMPIGKSLQHGGPVNTTAFSPDGARVVTASDDKTARVWDAATGAQIGKTLQHDDIVISALFSPDGARVVTASDDKTARVWDAATGAPMGPPLRHEGSVRSAAFSPDGARVVTASDDKTARIWEAATGAPIGPPLRHEGSVRSAAFSPDGARVVTASVDETTRLWNTATGMPIGKPLQHQARVHDAAFSPDGARVLTASGDNAARIWDSATGETIGRPLQHDGPVNSTAFSPDGARVVTASDDKTAQVWDVATGVPIGKPFRHQGYVYSAAFSPDGARVLTASQDKTARLWISPPVAADIVATACKMLRDSDTSGLPARYSIVIEDHICTGDEPAPDPSRMIDHQAECAGGNKSNPVGIASGFPESLSAISMMTPYERVDEAIAGEKRIKSRR